MNNILGKHVKTKIDVIAVVETLCCLWTIMFNNLGEERCNSLFKIWLMETPSGSYVIICIMWSWEQV